MQTENQYTPSQFIALLKEQIHEAPTQKDYALSKGVSAQYLGDILRGRRDPGEKLLKAMGFERVVIYQRAKEKKAA